MKLVLKIVLAVAIALVVAVLVFLFTDWEAPRLGQKLVAIASDAAISKGYKVGGFNANQDLVDLTFDPETGWNYELGFKSSLWEQLLQLHFHRVTVAAHAIDQANTRPRRSDWEKGDRTGADGDWFEFDPAGPIGSGTVSTLASRLTRRC